VDVAGARVVVETVDIPSDIGAASPHIIQRPRLIRLLGQTHARVILLVAPAGYGKTTLARQWLVDKPHVWYTATPASTDIALLASGIAEAARDYAPDAAERLRARLAASSHAERDAEVLGEPLAEEFGRLPVGCWLAIDDCHLLNQSSVARELVRHVASAASIRLLVAARHRPPWATARDLLYGRIFELGKADLAMDHAEAEAVLATRKGKELPGLVALAQGWPAVIGLAALTIDTPSTAEVPGALYEFFADELYKEAPSPLQDAIARLALLPALDEHLVREILGEEGSTSLRAMAERGFITASRVGIEFHPLLQDFVVNKLRAEREIFDRLVERTVRSLIRIGRWDDAFEVIARHESKNLLADLLQHSMRAMVAVGRLATLERWTRYARSSGVTSPLVSLADAEIAHKRGAYLRAESLAGDAARQLSDDNPLKSRAFSIAGYAAHLSDREEVGFDLHTAARQTAVTAADRREAIWGQLICANQLQLPIVDDLIHELEDRATPSAAERLRLAALRFVIGVRGSGVGDAVSTFRAAYDLVSSVPDPLVRTGFLNLYARALILQGFYGDALAVADELLADGSRHRLDFLVPHALVSKGAAELGVRRIARALHAVDDAIAAAKSVGDLHNQVDASAVRCRILIVAGKFQSAVDQTEGHLPETSNPTARAENMASRALALVGLERYEEAHDLSRKSQELSPSIESRALAQWASALATARTGTSRKCSSIAAAFAYSWKTGVLDSTVVVYRTFPEVVAMLAETDCLEKLKVIARRVDDANHLRDRGVEIGSVFDRLSRREQEVYELLVAGLTNKEIGQALFISDVTAKAHVRHILRKLGVRSRTEAVGLSVK
jgi:LuxR family transcriptional regulator, maltose regulon positive regulatory protein